MRIEYTRAPDLLLVRPGRFVENLRSDPDGCSLALVGLPNDIGVELNGGRPGASEGPKALRHALARAPSYDGRADQVLQIPIFDAGDVIVAEERSERGLLETHRRIEAVLTELYALDMTVVCIGGGHDSTLPALTALAEHSARGSARGSLRQLGGINVDAHLDVRERIGSGMPFRSLIERQHLDPERFIEYGLGRFSNDEGDLKWARSRGVRCIYVEDTADAPASETLLGGVLATGIGFVSIDLDGIDQAFAPGVSAPNPMGLRVEQVAALAEVAGRDRRVRQVDLMELCPRHDDGERTARVAARLLLTFAAGYLERARAGGT